MYIDAFRHWKNLHDRFLSLAQNYLTACATLETAFSSPPRSASDTAELESLLLLVNKELLGLSVNGTSLQAALGRLSRLRNRSKRLVPINVLPSEVLSSIFLTVRQTDKFCLSKVQNNEPPPDTSLDAIMSASSSWRLTATRTTQLWSHIDLFTAGYWKNKTIARAQLWLERSSNAPLVVHVQDVSDTAGPPPTDTDISDIVILVAAQLSRLRHLDVSMHKSDRRLARSILHCILVDSSVTTILETLRINVLKYAAGPDSFNILSASPSSDRPQTLAALRCLKLARVHIDWASGLYSGLTELNLYNLPATSWPTTKQMAAVLSSSPSSIN